MVRQYLSRRLLGSQNATAPQPDRSRFIRLFGQKKQTPVLCGHCQKRKKDRRSVPRNRSSRPQAARIRQGLLRGLAQLGKGKRTLFENSSQHLWAQQSGPDLLRSLGVSYRQGRAKVPESRRAVEGFGNHGQKPALVQ